eukprot:gene10120-20690_t
MKSTLSVTAPVLVALAAAVSGAHATGRYDAEYNVISKGSLQTSGIGKEATAHPLCLDNLGQSSDGSSVGVYDCHGEGGNQAFLYTTDDQIRLWIPESEETTNHEQVKNVHRCLDAASPPDDPTAIPRTVRQFLCHGKGGNQEWFHRWDDHTIRHIMEESLQCLETYALEGGGVGLQVNLCDGSLGQKWTWHAPRVRNYKRVDDGTCNDHGGSLILTEFGCEKAAAALRLDDTGIEVNNLRSRPYGCYYIESQKEHGRLHLNLNEDNIDRSASRTMTPLCNLGLASKMKRRNDDEL